MVEISKFQKIFSFIIMMIEPTEEEGINQIVNKPE